LSFDPCNRPLKIRESVGTPTPKVGLPWGVRVHSLTPSHTPGSMLCDFRLPSWPATLQTLALVARPRLRLRHAWSCFISLFFFLFVFMFTCFIVIKVCLYFGLAYFMFLSLSFLFRVLDLDLNLSFHHQSR
jgi:hypothetical protein